METVIEGPPKRGSRMLISVAVAQACVGLALVHFSGTRWTGSTEQIVSIGSAPFWTSFGSHHARPFLNKAREDQESVQVSLWPHEYSVV